MESSDPKIEAGQIIFPAGSSQLATLVVETVKTGEESALQLNGHLAWDEDSTVRIFPAFAGRLVQVLAEPGAKIEKGANLAIIASPDFGQARSDASKAASDLALAERSLARLRDLAAHGAAPTKDVTAAEADFERAQAEQTRASVRLALCGDAGSGSDNNYILKSPVSGMVVERTASAGQEVRPDQMLAGTDKLAAPLFVVTDPSHLWLQFEATEADLFSLHSGQVINIRTASLPERVFPATVRLISEALDPITRTAKIRASVDNSEKLLKAEMLVKVEAATAASSSFDVPAKAIFFKNSREYLFAETAPGHFSRREVQIGPSHSKKIQVLAGLKPGDRIVADGAVLLQQVIDTAGEDEHPPP